MKNKKLKIVTAVAFAAIGFVSASVSASAGTLDLILGFEITDPGTTSQGSTSNLELDLSAASSLTPGVLSSLIGNDLSSVYGSNWATRTDLAWGVAGLLKPSSPITDEFDATAYNGVQAEGNGSALHPAANAIGGLAANYSSGSATGAANSSGAVTLSTGSTGSWTYQITNAGNTSGQQGAPYFTSPTSETVVDGTKTADQSIELYQYNTTSTTPAPLGTDLGTFTLAGSGNNATFSFAAVSTPEPSAYALGISAVLLFVVLKRRSSIA